LQDSISTTAKKIHHNVKTMRPLTGREQTLQQVLKPTDFSQSSYTPYVIICQHRLSIVARDDSGRKTMASNKSFSLARSLSLSFSLTHSLSQKQESGKLKKITDMERRRTSEEDCKKVEKNAR
jgi:hypothetical protein